ncbi:MAG: bifunctional precorrin-2 dehydrogenase/sirohydrochlorin ferrochelatase [Candidatus Hydrothermarchaeaceae archaeon]
MFPVVLNLRGKHVVVFGGGTVAERRIAKFVKSGAKVKAVSEDFTKALKKMSYEKKELELVQIRLDRNNIREFLEDGDLVLVATNNKDLNNAIEKESKALGKWVNRADGLADFSIPAILELGSATIAISTMGKSPGVAKLIKGRVKRAFTEDDILQIELQEFARERLKRYVPKQNERKRILREIMSSPELLYLLNKGEIEKAKREVREMCDAYRKH